MNQSRESFDSIARKIQIIPTVSIVIGALLTFVYLRFIDALPSDQVIQSPDLLAIAGFVVGQVILNAVAAKLDQSIFTRLSHWAHQVENAGGSLTVPPDIQRLALNYVPLGTLLTFGMWVLVGVVVSIAAPLLGWGDPLRHFFAIVGVGGVITSALVYFVSDLIWRRAISLYFPDGRLSRVPAFRLPVLGRLLVVFLLVGVWPSAIITLLSLERARSLVGALNPELILSNLSILLPFILFASMIASVGMALLVTRSIVQPLRALQSAMMRLGNHEQGVMVPVLTNDEFGFVGEGFNEMCRNLARHERELQAVYRISQHIVASIDLDQTLKTVLQEVKQIIPYDGAEICLYDEAQNLLRVRAWAGADGVALDTTGRSHALGEGYTGWVGQSRQSLLVPDVDAYADRQPVSRQLSGGVTLNSYLGVPLINNERLVGTLQLVSIQRGAFDEHSRQLLETVAPAISVATANAAQVVERERRLKEQIAALRIEIDETKKAKSVAEITETDLFKDLQAKVRRIKGRSAGSASAPST